MRRALLLAAPLLFASAPVHAAPRPDTVQAVVADYEAFDRRVNPIGAGHNGDREALTRLPDDSPAADAEKRIALEGFAKRLRALPDPADAEAALNRELLLHSVDNDLADLKLDAGRINFDSYSGFHLTLSQLAVTTPIRDRADAEAWIARLHAAPAYYATETANARRGISTGFTQPRPTVEAVLAVAQKQVEGAPEDSLLLSPLKSMPATIPAVEQAALRARALQVVKAEVRPAQQAFVRFLQTEYLPHARASLAACDLPNGAAYYAERVRWNTTTDLTPDQIHALGEQEVARIRKAMEAVIAESGFKGSFQDWQKRLRSDPRFYVTSGDELLARSALFNKRVDDQLPRFFDTLPRLPFAVRPIPAESAEGATTAYYQEGSPQLGVAGGYMVNLTHLDQRPLYELPALTLHESEPGHHLQIALAQERTDLPRFRRDAYITAFVEGWALYAEDLGDDMGMYKTPEERFGHLSYEMWRACRLVADTGIHWLRWSRDDARRCFADNTALTPKNIEVELDRYISWPGQALAYKMGELKIMQLRRRAEAALGPKFDIRRFHHVVLEEGPLPLDILERRVDAWIAQERARA